MSPFIHVARFFTKLHLLSSEKCIYVMLEIFMLVKRSMFLFSSVQFKREMEKHHFWIVNEWSKAEQSKVAKAKCNKFSGTENWANVHNKKKPTLFIILYRLRAYVYTFICSFYWPVYISERQREWNIIMAFFIWISSKSYNMIYIYFSKVWSFFCSLRFFFIFFLKNKYV